MAAPDWMSAEFLKACLESTGDSHQEITVIGFTIEPAAPPGNNYGCIVHRVKLEFKYVGDELNVQSTSLIIKSPVVGGFMEGFSDFAIDIYGREPKYYNEFISETYKIEKHDIVPKHYISPRPLCVVLEDLKTSGYLMADRHELLDYEHCCLYVKASAKLHALSIAVYKKRPDVIESLVEERQVFAEKFQETFRIMWLVSLKCMGAYLEDKPCYKKISDFIDKACENDNLHQLHLQTEKENYPIKALIQGDPWCTNMMFKYDDAGQVVGLKIFDFQSLKFTSPIRELVTFLGASPNLEVRETKLDDLYHLYCDHINTNLEKFGCPERLSYENLKSELIFQSPLVILIAFMMLPFCIADGKADMESLLTEDTLKRPIKESPAYKLYEGKTFRKLYPKVLDLLAEEGVFEYLMQKMDQL
uniref:CHK kinase-like domain-containing protein n=1 Tax=Homalodisca liturata TaxID=320908 RepID=A0A1B6IW24_9HEMI